MITCARKTKHFSSNMPTSEPFQKLAKPSQARKARAQTEKPRAKSRLNKASLPPAAFPFQNNFRPEIIPIPSHLPQPLCCVAAAAISADATKPQPDPASTPSNPILLRRREAHWSSRNNVLLTVDPGEEGPAGHDLDRRAPRAQGQEDADRRHRYPFLRRSVSSLKDAIFPPFFTPLSTDFWGRDKEKSYLCKEDVSLGFWERILSAGFFVLPRLRFVRNIYSVVVS